jgi:hypothetical protein
MTWIANWLLSWATNIFAGVTNIFTAGVMAFAAFALFAISWHRHQRKSGNSGVEPSHLIWAGTIGALACLVLVLTGLLWRHYGAALPSTAPDNQQQRTFTAGIGTPPTPRHETIHWNEIFGTARAVDLVFSLFLDGTGPDDATVSILSIRLISPPHICHKPRKAKTLFPLNEVRFRMSTLGRSSSRAFAASFRPSAVKWIEDFKDHTLQIPTQFAKGVWGSGGQRRFGVPPPSCLLGKHAFGCEETTAAQAFSLCANA